MVRVIQSVDEFLRTLKIGDQFWYLYHEMGVGPTSIIGPNTVEGFHFFPIPAVLRKIMIGDVEMRGGVLLCGIIGEPYGGVLLSQEDALAYLEKRQRAYATEPELQTLLAEERNTAKKYDAMFDLIEAEEERENLDNSKLH